jgi:hypothetical protein
MKRLFRWLVVLAAPTSLVLLVVWSVRRFGWGATLFGAYLVIALFICISVVRSNLKMFGLRDPTDPLHIESAVVASAQGESRFQRARFRFVLVLNCVAESLVWPAAVVAMIIFGAKLGATKRTSAMTAAAGVALHPPIGAISTATMFMAALTAAVGWRGGGDVYASFLLLLALAVMLRHLVYFLHIQSMTTTLRRGLGDPYGWFAAIAAADILTLVLSFSGYVSAEQQAPLSFSLLRDTAVDMFTFEKLRGALLANEALGWFDALVGAAGGLCIVTGFKSVFNRETFKRTKEDMHAIAKTQLVLGNDREVRRWLDKIGEKDALTYEIYAAAYLLGGDLDKAKRAAASTAEENKVEAHAREREAVRTLLGNIALLPIAKSRLQQYLRHWFENANEDLFLQSALEALIRMARLHPQEVLAAFTDPDGIARHPLSYSTALMYGDRTAEGLEVLEKAAVPGPAEQLARLSMMFRWRWAELYDTGCSTEELIDWWRPHLGLLPDLAARLPDDAERVLVIDHVYGACDVAAAMRSPELGALQDLGATIRDEIGGNPRILTALAAIDASRKARQRLLREMLSKQPASQASESPPTALTDRSSLPA